MFHLHFMNNITWIFMLLYHSDALICLQIWKQCHGEWSRSSTMWLLRCLWQMSGECFLMQRPTTPRTLFTINVQLGMIWTHFLTLSSFTSLPYLFCLSISLSIEHYFCLLMGLQGRCTFLKQSSSRSPIWHQDSAIITWCFHGEFQES